MRGVDLRDLTVEIDRWFKGPRTWRLVVVCGFLRVEEHAGEVPKAGLERWGQADMRDPVVQVAFMRRAGYNKLGKLDYKSFQEGQDCAALNARVAEIRKALDGAV